jgi:2-methylisocitrate lyase-like PEP mutase family enzyme
MMGCRALLALLALRKSNGGRTGNIALFIDPMAVSAWVKFADCIELNAPPRRYRTYGSIRKSNACRHRRRSAMLTNSYGTRLRQAAATRDQIPFIGIYDAFSASIAAKHYDALFVSGFGFAASHYGLPDIGFIAWPDILDLVGRLRCILPQHHLLVDIDDGYCDIEAACHMVARLDRAGASGVVLEDQKRPRRCGHFGGKQLLEIDAYVAKLERVLATRQDIFVIARTDATDEAEIAARLEAYASAGADAVLADGLRDLQTIARLRQRIDRPLAFNQIAGGKSPAVDLTELRKLGATLVIYSTPCLFAAQTAIENAMLDLASNDGRLPAIGEESVGVSACTNMLTENMLRRDVETTAAAFCARQARAA